MVTVARAIAQAVLRVSFDRPTYNTYVSTTLAGLSIEGDRWPELARLDWNLTHPNNYTYTLLNNLKEKTGSAVPIR